METKQHIQIIKSYMKYYINDYTKLPHILLSLKMFKRQQAIIYQSVTYLACHHPPPASTRSNDSVEVFGRFFRVQSVRNCFGDFPVHC